MLVEVAFIQTLRGLVAEPTVATGVVLSALLVSSGLGSLLTGRLRGGPSGRAVLVAALAAAVPGFAMGLPFPYALSRTDSPAAVWMTNGVCSVVGLVAALFVAMTAGLSFALGLGALAYGAIAVCVARFGLKPGSAKVPWSRPAVAPRVSSAATPERAEQT